MKRMLSGVMVGMFMCVMMVFAIGCGHCAAQDMRVLPLPMSPAELTPTNAALPTLDLTEPGIPKPSPAVRPNDPERGKADRQKYERTMTASLIGVKINQVNDGLDSLANDGGTTGLWSPSGRHIDPGWRVYHLEH